MPTYNIRTTTQQDAIDTVYRSTEFAISGAINKSVRTSKYTFQETTANSLYIAAAEKYYFKSLDKVITPVATQAVFPQAPTAVNLITNGTFDTDTDTSGWTAYSSSLSIVDGKLRVTATATDGWAQQNISTVVGKKYVIEAIATAGTASTFVQVVSSLPASLVYSTKTGYSMLEFIATTTITYIRVYASSTAGTYADYDNIAVFPAEQLLCYDNLLLKDDGNYVITRTEQNQYITMDTMLNYTSKAYNVANGADTGTSITMTYDMNNEEYSGSDGHKYITIGATARLNQGAYHPVFNSGGSGQFHNPGVAAYPWWAAEFTTNIVGTFKNLVGIGYVPVGNLANGLSGRPDYKLYDVIYNELWIDQRWRAEWVDGTKERTTIERDKDIAATQYADFVGSATWETKKYITGLSLSVGETYYRVATGVNIFGSEGDNTIHYGLAYNGTSWLKIGYIYNYYDSYILSSSTGDDSMVSNLPLTGVYTTIIGINKSNLRYGSNTFLHTDIIGNPANYPQVWKDALAGGGSIAGTPLLVGENGESYIPDEVAPFNVKLSKKYIALSNAILTINYGTSFSLQGVSPSTITNDISDAGNSYAQPRVWIISYQAYNNNLAPIVNSKVVGGSAGVSDANIAAFSDASRSNKLLQNCIGKIGTNINLSSMFLSSSKIVNVGSIEVALVPYSATWQESPSHSGWSISNDISPTVKSFSYLTNVSTRHKQSYVFKEMKYDATGVNQDGTPSNTWGDNNQFAIVDNVSTITDNNGNTVLIGQKARLVDYRVKG